MDEDTTYELWVQTTDGKWGRIVDAESKRDLWPNRKSAIEVAERVAANSNVSKVIGVKRILSFTIWSRNEDPKLQGTAPRNPEGGA